MIDICCGIGSDCMGLLEQVSGWWQWMSIP